MARPPLLGSGTGSADAVLSVAAGTTPREMRALYPNSAVGEPIGGNSVIWNCRHVPPRPSPAIPASADSTAVNDGGSTVTSWPIIGTTVVVVVVAVPPRPSSYVTSSSRVVRLVTVYRILRTFAEMKTTETQRAEDGEMLYRLRTAPGHRHYLLCRRCGRAIGFTAGEFEHLTSQLAEDHRYTDVTHQIDFYGTCPRCTEV